MAKTKNVQDFCPAATRIYNAAKKGIVNRTNSGHVKRVIDKELDKHSLSTEKIQKEISNNVTKACAITTIEMKKSCEEQILKFENEAEGLVKTATKNLEDENKVLVGELKDFAEENKRLVERVNGLTEQNIELKNSIFDPTGSDLKEKSDPADKKQDNVPLNPDQEKKSSGKKM